MESAGLMLFWLIAIVVLIPAALWLLKRSGVRGMGVSSSNTALLKTVAQVGVGPGQRVVTMEFTVGDQKKWIVLGVTAHQITPLYTTDAPDPVEVEADASASSFPAIMRRASDLATPPQS